VGTEEINFGLFAYSVLLLLEIILPKSLALLVAVI